MALPATAQIFLARHIHDQDLSYLAIYDRHCPICHAPFRSGPHARGSNNAAYHEENDQREQAVRVDPCDHVFGRRCLEGWVKRIQADRNRCPTCQIELFGRATDLQARLEEVIRGLINVAMCFNAELTADDHEMAAQLNVVVEAFEAYLSRMERERQQSTSDLQGRRE
jgi:hypothetical protein